jgi:hypothetical protein
MLAFIMSDAGAFTMFQHLYRRTLRAIVFAGLLYRNAFLQLAEPVQNNIDLERWLLGRCRFIRPLHHKKRFAVRCDVVRAALGVFDRDGQGFRFAERECGFGLDIDEIEAAAGRKNELLSVVRPERAIAEAFCGDLILRSRRRVWLNMNSEDGRKSSMGLECQTRMKTASASLRRMDLP